MAGLQNTDLCMHKSGLAWQPIKQNIYMVSNKLYTKIKVL